MEEQSQIIKDIMQMIVVVSLGDGLNVKFKLLFQIATILYVYNVSTQVAATFLARGTEHFFDYFSVLSFSGIGILKLTSIRYSNKKWGNILIQASYLQTWEQRLEQSMTDSDQSEPCVHFKQKIGSYISDFTFIRKWLMKLYLSTLVIFILSPFFEYALYQSQGVKPLNPHVLQGWLVLDDTNVYAYLFTLAIEVVAAIYCVIAHISFDLASVGIIILICGQYSILHEYAMNICGEGRDCFLSKRRDDLAHLRIKHCHRIQKELVKLTRELDQLQRNILGIYFMLATFTLCSVAVRLKANDIGVMTLISLLQYMGASLAQLFLFCRFGEKLSKQSSMGMGEGVFGSAYWCISPKIRRELHLLSVGMTRSHSLHVGPFNTLDLQSFIQVLRAAYSYYTVVKK